MEKKSCGSFLAQGAVGSASVTYVWLIAMVLYHPNGYNFLLMLVLPIYLLVSGVLGAAIGGAVWLSGRSLRRKLGIIARSAIGILLATLVLLIFNLFREFIVDWGLLHHSMMAGLLLGLPAAAISGTRLRPLRFFSPGQDNTNLHRHSGNAFADGARLLLRCASLFFALESAIYMACLISSAFAGWGISNSRVILAETAVANLYFAAGVLVSFTSLRPKNLITLAVIVNAPLAIWSLSPPRVLISSDSEAMLILAWIFIFFWVLFIAGQSLSTPQAHIALTAGPNSSARLVGDSDSARTKSTVGDK